MMFELCICGSAGRIRVALSELRSRVELSNSDSIGGRSVSHCPPRTEWDGCNSVGNVEHLEE